MKKSLLLLLLAPSMLWAGNPLTLHYNRPAQFFEEALVIGNGNIGATIYGQPSGDRLSLNDITLWTGEPEREVTTPEAYRVIPLIREALDRGDYRAADSLQRLCQGHYSANYQPLGTLTLDFGTGNAKIADFSRTLDLTTATARTSFTADGHAFDATYYASAPDSLIVIELSTDDPRGLNVTIGLQTQLPATIEASGDRITADGYAAYHSLPHYTKFEQKHFYDPDRGIHFRTVAAIDAPGGYIAVESDSTISVSRSNHAVIYLTNVTSFNGYDRDPVREGRNYRTLADNRISHAFDTGETAIRDRQLEDYQGLFSRVNLDLGTTDPAIAALPTDVQLLLYTDSAQANPDLEELYFQFGRYLLISSSRTPGVPANLQGLWCESILPPWSSNYTTNINLEENYWPAEVTNLPEMHQVLIKYIDNLRASGTNTARHYYGVNEGWSLGQNSDIWAITNPVGLNEGHPMWANWTMGGAWLASHIWEQYLFSGNREQLAENYPALREAALFCLGWLVERDGHLMTSPGTSPENLFVTPDGYVGATSYGATADLAMTRQCLTDARDAALVLGTDASMVARIDSVLPLLAPYKIGHKGNLQEWYYDWEDYEPTHRHQSHLYGVYPGHQINPLTTPDLATAAAKSLEIRGDKTTGWSTGWRINLLARLLNREGAYHFVRTLLRAVSPQGYKGDDARRGGGTYPNLLDAHSPFQIDGNFGGTAGIAEMLLQSQPGSINLLPALPAQWSDGSVKGLRARGGFTVDIDWADGRVSQAVISSANGGETQVNVNGKTVSVNLEPGQSITLQ